MAKKKVHKIVKALMPLAVPIQSIKRDKENPRTHDERNISSIRTSLETFGQRKPVVVNRKNKVIEAGNGTHEAAEAIGWTHIAAVFVEDDKTTETGYKIADNRTAELAGWDYGTLTSLFDVLKEADIDVTGFNHQEIDGIATIVETEKGMPQDPDDIPEPPDKPTTKPGDLYVLGDHRLLCGNAGISKDVDKLLGGAAIHLVNTDPPYNVKVEPRSNNAISAGLSSFASTHHQSFDHARRPSTEKKTHKKMRPKDRPLENDFVTDDAFDEMLRAWFGQMSRVLKPGRSFYIWGGYANIFNYPAAFMETDLYFSQTIIWIKKHPVLTRKDFMGNHEWCFYGWKKGAAHYFVPNVKNAADVWSISKGMFDVVDVDEMKALIKHPSGSSLFIELNPSRKLKDVPVITEAANEYKIGPPLDVWCVKKISPQKMVHLTEKPVALASRAIRYSSKRGENVYDAFAGSGSTPMAAEETGRHAFCMELDPAYCDVIVQRWETFTGKKARRLKSKGVKKRK